MKILLVAPSVVKLGTGRYGGIEKMLFDFAAGLVGSHDVTIAAPVGSTVPSGTRLVETVELPGQQDRDDITAQVLGDCAGIDVIHDFSHLHGVSQRVGRLPAIFHVWHPMVHQYNTAPYNVVCVSEWQRARFERLYGQRGRTMPLLVNTDLFTPSESAERRRFLFLGNISQQKGVHVAIRLAQVAGIELDVVGGLIPSEWESPYLRFVEQLCDGDRIRLFFNVTEEEKVAFIKNARAMLYPVQQDEAGWLAGLEAWACGTPTIAFNRGSMSSILPPGRTVSCVVDTPQEFIARIASTPSTGEASAVRTWVQRVHSVESGLEAYASLYSDVASGLKWN